MPFWERASKLAGRVVAVLRIRPTIDEEETSHLKPANSLVGHDHSDLPPPSRPLPTSVFGLTSTHTDPLVVQSDTFPSFSVKVSSSDDPVYEADRPPTSRPLPISMIDLTSTHAEPTTAQLDTSPSLSDITTSDDPVHQDYHPSASFFSHARDTTVTGGNFYSVRNVVNVQRTERRQSIETEISRLVKRMEMIEEMMGRLPLPLPPTISMGFLYVMDATGRCHTLPMEMAHSFEQFNAALRVLFYLERPQNRVLRKYMDIGAFILTIDDGREYLQLTDEEWTNTVQSGMTIIMSVIMTQDYETTSTKYQCPFCNCWNSLNGNNGKSSINCRSCNRRFQVKAAEQHIDKTETTSIADNEQELIQNIHLRQVAQKESERIKYFWLGLGEQERRNLVKIEKDTVLRKTREHQKHSCSCAVCGRKRNVIEEELEVLYDAYYEELEQYANYQQRYVSSGGTIPPPPGPGPFPGSVELDKNGAVVAPTPVNPKRSHARGAKRSPAVLPPVTNGRKQQRTQLHPQHDLPPGQEIEFEEDEQEDEDYDGEDYEEEGEEEEELEEEEEEEDEEEEEEEEEDEVHLTVTGPGNILTVADDLLKNDGKKFLAMMEHLAERRMQRAEEAATAIGEEGEEGSDEARDGSEGKDDDDEDGGGSDDEDDDDDEILTEEQKMEEGKRMFSIFAARMFEQRVLQAYRAKV